MTQLLTNFHRNIAHPSNQQPDNQPTKNPFNPPTKHPTKHPTNPFSFQPPVVLRERALPAARSEGEWRRDIAAWRVESAQAAEAAARARLALQVCARDHVRLCVQSMCTEVVMAVDFLARHA